MRDELKEKTQIILLDTLDRVLNKGVIVASDITLSITDIDLIFLSLKILFSSKHRFKRT